MQTLSDYLHAKASYHKIPLDGTFELSPVCNFSCRMCYVRKTYQQIQQEGKSLHTWQEWLDLGKQCRDAGMLYLLLTGGEPFLYPNFRQLYTALHEMGLILSINSNGFLIDQQTVTWLKEHAPSRVNITLYGASRETYAAVCGNAQGFDRAMNAIQLLQEAGIPVVINASMIPENQQDLEKILCIGKELGLNVRMATYMFPPIRRESEDKDSRFLPQEAAQIFLRKARCLLEPEKYKELLADKETKVDKEDSQDWGSTQEYMRCRAGRSSFWVAWDGSMTACGLTQFPLVVNPFEEDFSQCWQMLTNRVRTTPVLQGCAGCKYKKLCTPCVAIVYAETGHVNLKAPYLCEMSQKLVELIRKEVNDCE